MRVTDLTRWRKWGRNSATHRDLKGVSASLSLRRTSGGLIYSQTLRCTSTGGPTSFQSCSMGARHGPSVRPCGKAPRCLRHLVSVIQLAESNWWGQSAPELWGPCGMEEGKGPGCLAPSRQYGNPLLEVRHQERDMKIVPWFNYMACKKISSSIALELGSDKETVYTNNHELRKEG